MSVSNDATLWRYGSVHEALLAGSALLARLIQESEISTDTANAQVEAYPAPLEQEKSSLTS